MQKLTLGQHWSYNMNSDPKRLCFVLSRYNFAARLGAKGKSVLELGCSEGLGAIILSEFAKSYTGVDLDAEAIAAAKNNWDSHKLTFICEDFIGIKYGEFDTIVSMDVIEHIEPEYEDEFFETVCDNMQKDGICVIGTPNIMSAKYASTVSNANHVNLYNAERLRSVFQKYFLNTFIFSMNDEIIHTGFYSMAHFLIAVGCSKKGKDKHHFGNSTHK